MINGGNRFLLIYGFWDSSALHGYSIILLEGPPYYVSLDITLPADDLYLALISANNLKAALISVGAIYCIQLSGGSTNRQQGD